MTQNTTGYSDEEIQNAVQGLVQTSVSYPVDSLGVQKIQVTFSDVQQAAVGVFMLYPTSVFYAVQLGASRLNELLQTQAQQVNQLLSLIQAAGRRVLPVADTTPLSNASVALASLQAAATSRTSAFVSITAAPAYQNFAKNVSNFLAANGSAIKAGGAVVPTPQEAVVQMGILYPQVVSAQALLIQNALLLQNALADYLSTNLPSVAASSVLANASQNLATLVAQLEPQSPTDRLSSLRDTVLQLLSMQAIVQQVAGFSQPSSIYPLAGTGTAYADAEHLGLPAQLAADLYAPYAIGDSPTLTVEMDDQPALSFVVNNSQFAEMFGTTLEPFVFDSSNNKLVVKETTSATTTTQVIPPGTYSAPALATYLSTVLGPKYAVFAQGNAGSQFIDIRYVASSPTPTFKAGISFPTTTTSAAAYLGFAIDATVSAKPSSARQIAAAFNQVSPTLLAGSQVDPAVGGVGLLMRSEPTDPARVVLYRMRGTGIVTLAATDTLHLLAPAGLLAAGVIPGDRLVCRSGVNANTLWVISSVTDTLVTATGTVTPVDGEAFYEIGPNLLATVSDVTQYVLEVPGTGINAGVYGVVGIGVTDLQVPFEVGVDSILHGVQAQGNQPYFFSGNVGQEKVIFKSQDTSTASAVQVSGSAAALFFASPPASAVGQTSWVQLPESVLGIGPGDTLEYYSSNYAVPDLSLTIQSVEGDLLGLAATVPDTQIFPFFSDTPPPYALLRSGAFAAYAALSLALEAWGALDANQGSYFSQLQPLINSIINSPQPTLTQIDATIQKVQQLQDVLASATSATPSSTLDAALSAYSVVRVAPVDNLIALYTEKGSGRAVDMLLQGNFSTFFGLTPATASYAGALQAQMQAVAQSALPVRKTNRSSAVTSQVSSTMQSPDFEYDTSDAETGPAPDVPTNFEQVSPIEQGFT